MALLVNGERVSDQELEVVSRQMSMEQIEPPAGTDYDPADLDAMAKEAVISRVLVKQEAVKRNVEVPREEIDAQLKEAAEECGGEEEFKKRLEEAGVALEDFEGDIALRIRVDLLLDEVCKDLAPPSDDVVKAYFESHEEQFAVPERIRVAHIVKHVQGNVVEMHAAHEELSAMLAEIHGGRAFEELAAENSDCPDNAGDLGYFAKGAMVPEFEDVVFAMEKEEVSKVFQTPFGLHIAKLHDRIPASMRPFDEVKEEVREHLFKEAENEVIDVFTAELRKDATVEEVEEEKPEAEEETAEA